MKMFISFPLLDQDLGVPETGWLKQEPENYKNKDGGSHRLDCHQTFELLTLDFTA